MFECDYQFYDIIMSACTPKEEVEWRCRLTSPFMNGEGSRESNWFAWLSLDIKPLGTVFGKPGMFLFFFLSLERHPSLYREQMVNPV